MTVKLLTEHHLEFLNITYAQADLRLCWSHKLHCLKSYVSANIMSTEKSYVHILARMSAATAAIVLSYLDF